MPLDGSERSRTILPLARALVEKFGVQMMTVTVDDDGNHDEVDVVLTGDPAEALLDHLDQLPDSVVCLSSHGRGGLGRRLVGSVAEQLIQHGPVPAIVAGPNATNVTSTPRSILAGVAWPPGPDPLVALLSRWAPQLQAAVEFAHVRSPSAAELYTERITGHGPPDRPALEPLTSQLLDHGIDATVTRLIGNQPETALCRRADQLPAPVLIAVDSRQGNHDPEHNVAYQLIRRARWPILATARAG